MGGLAETQRNKMELSLFPVAVRGEPGALFEHPIKIIFILNPYDASDLICREHRIFQQFLCVFDP